MSTESHNPTLPINGNARSAQLLGTQDWLPIPWRENAQMTFVGGYLLRDYLGYLWMSEHRESRLRAALCWQPTTRRLVIDRLEIEPPDPQQALAFVETLRRSALQAGLLYWRISDHYLTEGGTKGAEFWENMGIVHRFVAFQTNSMPMRTARVRNWNWKN